MTAEIVPLRPWPSVDYQVGALVAKISPLLFQLPALEPENWSHHLGIMMRQVFNATPRRKPKAAEVVTPRQFRGPGQSVPQKPPRMPHKPPAA